MNASAAPFTGIEKMRLNSITLVFQFVIKTILVPALVILGLFSFGAIIGTTVTFMIPG